MTAAAIAPAPIALAAAHRGKAIAVGGFAAAMSGINGTILFVAYPTLAEAFHTDASTILWLTVGPQVLMVGLLYVLGRLGDLFGRCRVLAAGFAILTVSFVASPFAPNIIVLILILAVQGIGQGIMNANSIATLVSAFPEEQRGKAVGLWAAIAGVSLSAGPLLGGLLVDKLGWESLFYARLPAAVLGLVMTWRLRELLPPLVQPRKQLTFDVAGAVLLFLALVSLLLGINRAKEWGVASPAILTLLTASVILFPAFYRVELRVPSPVIDFPALRHGPLLTTILVMVLLYTVYASFYLLVPFYLVSGREVSPLHAGILMAAFPLAFTCVSPLSGYLSDRLHPWLFVGAGIAAIGGGIVGLRSLGLDSSTAAMLWPIALLGTGHGLFDTASTTIIMRSMPPERLGTANASVSTSRQVGIALGMAGAGAIFSIRQADHTEALTSAGLPHQEAAARGLVAGFHDALWLGAICALVALVVVIVLAGRAAKQHHAMMKP